MSNPKLKEYVFERYISVTEETTVKAKSYKEAEDIFLSGGGDTEETYNASDWWMCTEDHNELEAQDDTAH